MNLRALFLPTLALALLPATLGARTATVLQDALGVFPMEWFEAQSPERAANACMAWAIAFHEAGDEENREAMLVDVCNSLTKNRSPRVENLLPYLRVFPDDTVLLNAVGWYWLISEDRADLAVAYLRRIPHHTDSTLDSLAWAQFRLGHITDALQSILTAVEISRGFEQLIPTLYVHAGDIFYANGLRPEALAFWNRALKIEKRIADADILMLMDYDAPQTRLKRDALRTLLREEKARQIKKPTNTP